MGGLSERPGTTSATGVNATPALEPLRVLLAEDHPLNANVTVALLRMDGHTVVLARNGKEAVAAAQREAFDVVLMDVEMPEMDGLEATAAIRASEQSTGAHVPIVAITGHEMVGDRERFLNAGMDEYTAKPNSCSAVRAALAVAYKLRERTPSAVTEIGPAPASGLVDKELLLVHFGGNVALVRRTVNELVSAAPQMIADLRSAVLGQDPTTRHAEAHKFKGAIANFCAPRAFQCASNLYQRILEGNEDSQIRQALADLELSIAEILPQLANFGMEIN